MASRGLTPRMERFVAEYLVDLNATQAYIRAGYLPTGARANAARLIATDSIASRIAELRSQVQRNIEVTIERTVQEIAARAFPKASAFYSKGSDGEWRLDMKKPTEADLAILGGSDEDVVMVGDPNQATPILKRKVKLVDQAPYLNMLMKHLGGYAPEKHALTDTEGNDLDLVTRDLQTAVARASLVLPRGGAVEAEVIEE